MLRLITILSAMIAMVAALSVEVNIKGPEKGACKGVITFVALDSDCGDCLYGVKDFRYATVKCRTQAAAEQCCKTVTKSCNLASEGNQKRMSYSNRRNQSSTTSTRTVSYNSGGLNERFSKIVKSAVSQRMPTAVNNTPSTGGGSVFSRLRGAKTTPRGKPGSTNIQNRLGKTNSGGIKKRRAGPSPMEGIERQKGRVAKRVVGKKQPTKQGSSKQSPQQKQKKKVAKKPATTEDLDKALDAYMMKDPKTAQAKLDAELTSYMDEAGDILMDENL